MSAAPRRTRIAVLAGLLAILAVSLTAGTSAKATTSNVVSLDGVRTTLWTDPATTKVLLSHNIVPLPAWGTSVTARWTPQGVSIGYGFPIPSGRVDAATLAGYINHTGGLRFLNLANGHSLRLTAFRIVINGSPGLSAMVNGDPNTRVRILNLNLSHATVDKTHLPTVRVNGVGASLTATAASALNSSLGVSFFAPGIKLGTAYVNAHIAS